MTTSVFVQDTPNRPMLKPAAFIDRDGVINQELGYVHKVLDFHLLPGVVQGLQVLGNAGFELVVITNQAGIAHGHYTEADFQRVTAHMLSLFSSQSVRIAGVFHCPHHPQGKVPKYTMVCKCRKPEPGLLLAAARDLGLDLSRSVVIGDKVTDTQAGRAAGAWQTVLVRSGHALPSDADHFADHVGQDLFAAAVLLTSSPKALHKVP